MTEPSERPEPRSIAGASRGAQNGYNVECPPPRRDPEPPPDLPPFHLPELTETPWFPRRA